jgi:hypothetical protein
MKLTLKTLHLNPTTLQPPQVYNDAVNDLLEGLVPQPAGGAGAGGGPGGPAGQPGGGGGGGGAFGFGPGPGAGQQAGRRVLRVREDAGGRVHVPGLTEVRDWTGLDSTNQPAAP